MGLKKRKRDDDDDGRLETWSSLPSLPDYICKELSYHYVAIHGYMVLTFYQLTPHPLRHREKTQARSSLLL